MKAEKARVLLTGAGGGIGKPVAVALAEAGAALLLVGRSGQKLSALATAISRKVPGAHVAWSEADLCDAEALSQLAGAARDFECNVVIHGAGISDFGRLEDTEGATMDRLMRTNLLAPMMLTQLLLPHLLKLPRAQIIYVGSALGGIGLPGFSVYSASKFGLRGFAQALRRELADTQLRVQYLGPRSTQTEFNSSAVIEYNRATGTSMDSPELVARAIVQLLASDRAEKHLGFPEKIAVRLNGLAPGWLDSVFAKHRRSLRPRHASIINSFQKETNNAG